MAELTDGERVISRARMLMATKGYGWSKAIDIAAQTLEPSPGTRDRAHGQEPQQRATGAQKGRDGHGV